MTSAGAVTGAVFDGTSWSSLATISGTATSNALSLAMVPATGQGVGLLEGPSNELVYTVYDGSSWSSLAQLNSDTTQGTPSVVGVGNVAHAVFWGMDYEYFYEEFTGGSPGSWTAAPQGVFPTGLTNQPCGPSPAVPAPLGHYASLVFVNGNCNTADINNLYNTDLSASGWSAADDVASNPTYEDSLWPAVTAPVSGPELVTAYVMQNTTSEQIYTASRTAGTWSTPAALTNGLTFDPMALAPLPGSGALLAYEGTDGNLYTAAFDGTSWATPAAPFTLGTAVESPPALAAGIGTAMAEMVYLDTSGALWHTRLTGAGWSSPTAVGSGTTGFTYVAIASGP